MKPGASTERGVHLDEFHRKHRTGLVTLVFTDMVESTALKQRLGDQTGAAFFEKHHQIVRELLARYPQGQEIETAGDSFLITFATPSDAVQFALGLQSKLRQLAKERGLDALDRIGIHVGEVVVKEDQAAAKPKDLYGIQIDVCARVMDLAKAGQILMTRSVFDSARAVLKGEDIEGVAQLEWLNHGSYLLKGVPEPAEICEVGEAGQAILSAPANTDKVQRHVSGEGEPVLGWRPALEQPIPGTPWVLEKKLGEGGFGEVWLGRHRTLKELRVFKFCFRADRVRSLKREVTLFRLLRERCGQHPNIVGVQDVFFDEPPFYLIMDYAEGTDLLSWSAATGGLEKVPLATRLEIVAQVADALHAAHSAGIIHRDVKPSNVVVAADTGSNADAPARVRVKLTDFGIGQVVSSEALAGITRMGFTQTMLASESSSQSGTYMYMAPELMAGKPASIQSDIYSLGVMLYQMVVGDLTRPLTMDWAQEIPDPFLREDLARCFAGNPQDRSTSASQLAANLRSLETRHRAVLQAKNTRRRRIVRSVAVGLALIVTLPTMYFLRQKWSDQRRSQSSMKQLGAVYQALNTYQDNAVIRQQLEIGGMKQDIHYTSSLIMARPNRINLALSAGFQEIKIVSDGKQLWSYAALGDTKIYTVKNAPPTLDEILEHELSNDPLLWGIIFALNLYRIVPEQDPVARMAAAGRNIKLIGIDQVEGQPVFVFTWEEFEQKLPEFLDPNVDGPEAKMGMPVKAWINKDNGLILKLSKDIRSVSRLLSGALRDASSSTPPPDIKQFVVTETHREILLNKPVSETNFVFTPPAQAKLAKRFSLIAALNGDRWDLPRDQAELAKRIPPRPAGTDPRLIDLSAYYNELLTEFLGESPGNDLSSLPRGEQTFGGTKFDVRGVIHLNSRMIRFQGAPYPEKVTGIKIQRRCQRLHFLHASHWVQETDGTRIGSYHLHYADKLWHEIPLIYGEQIRDWWKQKDSPVTTPIPAWTGTNQAAAAKGTSLQLFKTTWENPSPTDEIESVDFIGSMARPAPFLIAITAE